MTTRIHAVVDALGPPVRFGITPGHWGDCPQAQGLLAGIVGLGHGIADAGDDSDPRRRVIGEELGAEAQIKQNPSRAGRQPIDWALNKERRLVACFFNRITRFRRIALRCEKSVPAFRAFVALACTRAWLA